MENIINFSKIYREAIYFRKLIGRDVKNKVFHIALSIFSIFIIKYTLFKITVNLCEYYQLIISTFFSSK